MTYIKMSLNISTIIGHRCLNDKRKLMSMRVNEKVHAK